MKWEGILEIIFVCLATLILFLYHLLLFLGYHLKPNIFILSKNVQLREHWVTIMADHHDVVAIQTLRNVMIASSFLGSANLGVLTWAASRIISSGNFTLSQPFID